MIPVESNIIFRVNSLDCDMDEFVAAKIKLDEMVAKLENYLKTTKLYTEKKNTVWVEYEPELDDFVCCDELPDSELKNIAISFKEYNIFDFTQRMLSGYVGKVVNHTDNWEFNRFYC